MKSKTTSYNWYLKRDARSSVCGAPQRNDSFRNASHVCKPLRFETPSCRARRCRCEQKVLKTGGSPINLVMLFSIIIKRHTCSISSSRNVSFNRLGMAQHMANSQTVTTTLERGEREEVIRESSLFLALRHASRLVRAIVTDGRLGALGNPSELGDEFLAASYEQINDANRELLRLEPGDEQGLQSAFQSYVNGSTFVTSSLLGHYTSPLSVPATFFGKWAHVAKYRGASLTVPWYVVAVAFSWMRCAASMWMQVSESKPLAQEVRTTLAELANASGNTSLISGLDKASNETLRLSVDHFQQGQRPRNTFDQLLRETLQWAADRVTSNMSEGEIDLMERSQRTVLEQLMSGDVSDSFSSLEYIGPMRLVARMGPNGIIPTEEAHVAALARHHTQILDGMKRSIRASENARETNEMLAQHREDVWRGNFGMKPMARRELTLAFSEGAPSFHASTLEGSLAADRSNDFAEENDKDLESEDETESSESELEDGDEDIDHVIEERRQLFTVERTIGLLPVEQEVEPLDLDDSRSAYCASTLSGFANQRPATAPSVAGSAASGFSFTVPLEKAIAARSRDSGPSLVPVETKTDPIDLPDDKISSYTPSVLSQLSATSRFRAEETRNVPARGQPVRDADDNESLYAASSLDGFSRAPSGQSKRGRGDDPLALEREEKLLPLNVSKWATEASSITDNEEMLLQEGSVVHSLMEDNATLQHHVVSHRSGEQDLVWMLTQAHDELGLANASLNAKEQSIAQLQETLKGEKENHAREVGRLLRELEDAKKALTSLRTNAKETSRFIDTLQGDSNQAISHLNEQLGAKSIEVQTLQRQCEDLTRAVEDQATQLVDLRLEIQRSDQNGKNLNNDLEQFRARVMQLSVEIGQRDAALKDLNDTVAKYKEKAMELEMKGKEMENERDHLQEQLHEFRVTAETEMRTTKNEMEELSIQNKDLSDSLEKSLAETRSLRNIVETRKSQQLLDSQEKEKQLLESKEQERRTEVALREAKQETMEIERIAREAQAAILKIGRVVGVVRKPEFPEETDTFASMIRDQLETERERARQSMFGLAIATGVSLEDEVVNRGPVSAVLEQIKEKVGTARYDKEQTTHAALKKLATATSEQVDPNWSTQELIGNIQSNIGRLVGENRDMRQGLSALTDVSVKVTSIELIREAQEKFRSLRALSEESRNEVASLRKRIENLQGELDRERHEHHRREAENQQNTASLHQTLEQLHQRLSQASERGIASETDLEECRSHLAQQNARLDDAIAASRHATETLSTREADFHLQLQQANEELERTDREMNELKAHVEYLQRSSNDREREEGKWQVENEQQKQTIQRRLREKEDELRVLQDERDRSAQRCEQAIEEKRQATVTLSLREAEWQQQLQLANAESRRAEEEVNGLLGRLESITRTLRDCESERATQDRECKHQLQDKEERIQALRDQVNRLAEHSDSRQVDQVDWIALRLERDQLASKVADLQAQTLHQQQTQINCDRLSSLNDQLMTRLREAEDARAVQDGLIAELKSQVATLEGSLDFEEPRLEGDDDLGLTPSQPPSLDPEGDEQRLNELGKRLAEREYELVILDGKVQDQRTTLADLLLEIEDAEATLAELYAAIETIRPLDQPLGIEHLPDVASPPTTPVSLGPTISLDEWKERFPVTKPSFLDGEAKRWVLETGNAMSLEFNYDAGLHDSLLDPCMRFEYREQVDDLLRQTLAFVSGGSPSERSKQTRMFRGLDNLQRLAMRAKRYRSLDGFRLGTVCEFIVPLSNSIPYQGAVVQRYCELIVEMAMVIKVQWRSSASQQTRRLIFTECGLPSNDPTAIVVRFLASPFQPFDRCKLVETILKHLVAPGLGSTIYVELDAKESEWSPRESFLRDFDEITPSVAPTDWIVRHLEMATMLVPGLVHVAPGQTIEFMSSSATYVQIARLGHTSDEDIDHVLLVGQLDAWIVIDPLWSEGDRDLDRDGQQFVGVLKAPHGVALGADRGFALMTWIREVFVHGKPIDDVHFRGQLDRDRCTLEHYLRCLFHS